MSQNGQSVSDHFGTLCIKGLKFMDLDSEKYSFLKNKPHF